ncbi:Acyl-coenzyme A oxidase [Spirosomataceae bacterium TFI 002]|nr:Acyl-coenzyme A oxidase [Spirosomataceae bacterium TFI 002]
MKYSSGVLSVLPLFYVGWADSVLSPSEMQIIRKHIQKMDFLSPEDKILLISWTDQKKQPNEETYKSWLEEIRKYAEKQEGQTRKSLADLGLQLAKESSQQKDGKIWDSPKVKSAVEKLEAALGVDNELSKVVFYSSLSPETSVEIETYSAFDTAKMQSILDGKWAPLKNKVKKLLQDPLFAVPVEMRDKDELRALILKQTIGLADQGYGAYAYPKEYGGTGEPAGTVAIFEALGMGNISLLIKYGVQFGLWGGAVYQLGTAYHHKTYLTPTGTGELLGCFAMTETGHGSNVRDLETITTYDHAKKELIVHSPTYTAGKEYIGNALHSQYASVFTQLIVDGVNHGIHAVIVRLRDENHNLLPGIKVEDCGYKMGLNGVDNGRIWFDNVRVPLKNLLNKYGGINDNGEYQSSIKKDSKRFFTMLGALVGGRVSIAAASNTIAKKSLDIAIKYALKRRQFNSTGGEKETLILDYPTHHKRLFPLLAKSYALTFALENLRNKYGDNYGSSDQREVEALAAGLKSYASWHATSTIQECREACGGKGYLAENEFTDLKGDSDIFTTFEGDNTVLLQLVAKSLLTEFKQEFNDGGYTAIARYALRRVSARMTQLNPFNTRNTNSEHILSRDFQDSALKYREEKLFFTLSDRMRNFIKKKLSGDEIFLRVQTHMIALAKAHVEYYIYQAFATHIDSMEEGPERKAMETMLSTFALDAIYADNGWFLENEFISGDKSKAIRKVLNKLYRTIRPMAGDLVKSFGIPESLRKAQIATGESIYA